MPDVVTICAKCGTQYAWNTDFQEMPDCPKCGYNQYRQSRQSDISGLVSMLKSSDEYERNRAAAELAKRSDLSTVEPLIAALDDTVAVNVLPVALALGRIGDERAVEPLIRVMQRGRNYGPSGVAAEALASIGSTRAIQAVAERIDHIDYSSLGKVFGAFKNKGKPVVPLLVPMLRSENRDVRAYAATVLADLEWLPPDEADRIVFLATAWQWDKLREMGPTALAYITSALTGVGHKDLVRLATIALEKIGWIPSTEEDVLAYLRGGGKEGTLIQAGATAVKPLVEALKDNKKTIRITAAKSLCGIADPIGLFQLITSDVDDELRDDAVKILCKTATSDTVDQFVCLLSNSNDSIKHTATVALGDLGDARAVDALLAVLSSTKNTLRFKAVQALGKIADTRAVETLTAMVTSKRQDLDKDVRNAAADAVEKITGIRPKTPAEQARAKVAAEEKRRTTIQAARRADAKCEMCGGQMPLLAKLIGLRRHARCKEWTE